MYRLEIVCFVSVPGRFILYSVTTTDYCELPPGLGIGLKNTPLLCWMTITLTMTALCEPQ